MTYPAYDGTTPLKEAIALLVGCSPKSNTKLASLLKPAKEVLNITGKRLTDEQQLKIYNWVAEKFSQENTEVNDVEIISQPEKLSDNLISQAVVEVDAELFSQPKIKKEVIKNDSAEIISHTDIFDSVRVSFYIQRNGKRERQVIALDGFFINALSSMDVPRSAVPQWVQAQIDDWSSFDAQLPITRQVKYLIMREVVKYHSGSDDCFYDLQQ